VIDGDCKDCKVARLHRKCHEEIGWDKDNGAGRRGISFSFL
jgi:hypothetical protein